MEFFINPGIARIAIIEVPIIEDLLYDNSEKKLANVMREAWFNCDLGSVALLLHNILK